MKNLFWLAALLLASVAGAQDLQACGGEKGFPAWVPSGVYSGKIGTLPIYLQLDRQTPELTAYFYQSRGVDLNLAPFHDGEQLILQEQGWNVAQGRQVATGCLSLGASGKNLVGRWTTPDARGARAVTLTPLNVAALPLKLPASPQLLKLRREQPLMFLKLNRPWVKVIGGLKEPYSGVVYPRLSGATAALNTFMQDQQLQYASDALGCASEAGSSPAVELWYTVKPRIEYQTAHLLSLSETGDGYCGGAHPFLLFAAYTLNKATAKPFKPSDLWPGLTAARLRQLYTAQLQRSGNECLDATFTDMTSDPQTMLTPRGLAIYNDDYPEAARQCRTVDVTLPYAQLRAEANPKSPYYRDIYK